MERDAIVLVTRQSVKLHFESDWEYFGFEADLAKQRAVME